MNNLFPPRSQMENVAQIFFSYEKCNYATTSKVVAPFAANDAQEEAKLEKLPPRPVTVLNVLDRDIPNTSWLLAKRAHMLAEDDVFTAEFFSCVLLSNAVHLPAAVAGSEVLLGDWSSSSIYAGSTRVPLRDGPYSAIGSALYKAYRLYADPQDAFMFGVRDDEDEPGGFIQSHGSAIPVPSRLYSESPCDAIPLSGKCFGVKDVYDLKGTPTSASYRDYQSFSGKASATAEMVQRLIRAGGVVVGKTKTSQFASGEYACDWVDYLCPFNPRGNGYLDPDRSSNGSAAGLAAYEWLDNTIGTDTLGSIVGPAACNGVFAIRPTHGISDMEGVVPVSKLLDTAGCFSRSIVDLQTLSSMWYSSAFIVDLERALNISTSNFSITEAWDDEAPAPITRPIQDFLQTTLAHIQLYDCYRNNAKWRTSFKEQMGREPHANPMIRFKWGLGSKLSLDDYETACEEKSVYRAFLREKVFKENTVLILPCGPPTARYRDVYDLPPEKRENNLQEFGFLRDLYAFLGGLPMVIVPVGQVLARSSVTGNMVYEPVSISLVGAPGMDCKLIDLAATVMSASGHPMEVKVGKSLYETLD
ncbi:related to D-mandelate dehydrogenase [Rhynchosporium secalis]|uniref:Related to D-mandelate dehydrogenase n=1 Tax=Rhynchosporium secalis TaxID=38038 RepID=A0A1E1MLH8_RHYSE|nr:related to D-mandelate dehydrogenase [Rhynchosporium secalis]